MSKTTAPGGLAAAARLTGAGLAAVEEASRVVAGVEERMLAGLDHDGRATLLTGLVACADALAEDVGPRR